MPKPVLRPTLAEINLGNLAYNLNSLKEFVGNDKLYMAVVKADAYGHGAAECSLALENAGADWFGVAIPEEGIELRIAGVKNRILSLGSFWEGQEQDLLNNNITPVLFDLDLAESLDNEAKSRGIEAAVHIKIDTGMGRVGVPFEKADDFARKFASFKNLRIEGMMTHFASAEDLAQTDFTEQQIHRFEEVVEMFSSLGMEPEIRDLANSAGAVAHPASRGSLVRLGGVIYGLSEDVLPQSIPIPDLKPVMSLTTEVSMVKEVPAGRTLGYGRTFTTKRDSVIATIPIGYQDGYMRALSNKGHVLIKGQRAPVVGRVSMDWTIVDVTEIEEVRKGDRVTLIGHDGGSEIKAEELGRNAGTISYEVTCGINRRVTRKYVEG